MRKPASAQELQERSDAYHDDANQVLDCDVFEIGAALTAALDRNTDAVNTVALNLKEIHETLNLIRADRLREGT